MIRLSTETEAGIVAAHGTLDTKTTAERFGVSYHTVRNVWLRNGKEGRKYKRLTAADRQRAAELRMGGLTQDAIAADLGVSQATISKTLRTFTSPPETL